MAERNPGAPRRSIFADVGFETFNELIPADETVFLVKDNADVAAGVTIWEAAARPHFFLNFTINSGVPGASNILHGVNIFVEMGSAVGYLNYRIVPVWEVPGDPIAYDFTYRSYIYVPGQTVRFRACNISDTDPVRLRGWIKQTGSV